LPQKSVAGFYNGFPVSVDFSWTSLKKGRVAAEAAARPKPELISPIAADI
jgi:hypothetical protein